MAFFFKKREKGKETRYKSTLPKVVGTGGYLRINLYA